MIISMPLSFERGPSRSMLRDAKMGTHINDRFPTDEFDTRMLVDDFDAAISHLEKTIQPAEACFLADEKKRYQDNTY